MAYTGDYKMQGGKYIGLPLSSIIKFNPGYILWMSNKFSHFKLDDEFRKEVVKKYSEYERFIGNQQNAWAHGFGKNAKSARMKYDSEMISIEFEEREKHNAPWDDSYNSY